MWKDIEGYEGLYQISDKGEVKSLPKEHRYGLKTEKILKPRTTKENEYARVSLCKDGKVKGFRRCRLVALTFIPNTENKPTVNHKNGKRDDDRVCNLEWATGTEQNIHAYKLGLKVVTENWRNKMKEIHIGRKNSNETKLKMRLAKVGKTPWNKGMTKQEEYEYRLAKNN